MKITTFLNPLEYLKSFYPACVPVDNKTSNYPDDGSDDGSFDLDDPIEYLENFYPACVPVDNKTSNYPDDGLFDLDDPRNASDIIEAIPYSEIIAPQTLSFKEKMKIVWNQIKIDICNPRDFYKRKKFAFFDAVAPFSEKVHECFVSIRNRIIPLKSQYSPINPSNRV